MNAGAGKADLREWFLAQKVVEERGCGPDESSKLPGRELLSAR